MKENAIVLTAGLLEQGNAKTAHGLIRNSSRYQIIAVIDSVSGGKDAGVIVDNVHRNIPVYASVAEFLTRSSVKATFAIVGVALAGGRFTPEMLNEIRAAIGAGLSIVSGLHEFLSDIPEIRDLAERHLVTLTDIRKPRPKNQLKFWTGDIYQVKTPVIAVLGTDCSLGKRTTAVMVTEELRKKGHSAYMIFTGQTGWLQGHEYGFILDSTYNDFISGELEDAVLRCDREKSPDFIFLEGQSALSNPSGPCGAEYLMSAGAKGVILQHAPIREYFHGQEEFGIRISIDRDLEIIRQYDATVIAITLNTSDMTLEEAKAARDEYEIKYQVPVILPIEEGVEKLANAVLNYSASCKKSNTLS